MSLFSTRGIKLFSDLDIDLKITSFIPKESLRLLVCHKDDELIWNVKINDHFDKFAVIAKVGDVNVYAPTSGSISEIYIENFKGTPCVFCKIVNDEFQMPSYPVLKQEELPKDIFELRKLALDAVICDDYNNKLFYETLNSTCVYKKIILNCCDDEPYNLSKTATFMNFSDEVLEGLKIIANSMEIPQLEIAIFKNFRTERFLKTNSFNIDILKLDTHYPISSKLKRLIYKEHAFIVTPEICKAVYRASYFKEPSTTRIISAWGDGLLEPKILEVPLGTPINDILKHCSSSKVINKIVASGVISGYLTAPHLSITRYDDAVTVLTEQLDETQKDCINCGKCIEVCPEGLAPCYILKTPSKLIESKFLNTFRFCSECGCCSYICPARIPLKSYIKSYKLQLKKVQNEQK